MKISIISKFTKKSTQNNFLSQIRKSKLSNIELIALVLFAESQSIDSECQLFREIKGWEIASKIERSVYNRRKRRLFPLDLFNQVNIRLESVENV